jgi:hypothetical protein
MPCLAYRRAAVRNAGSPVKPATDASHACGDSRFSTAEWGKFAVDSPLEQSRIRTLSPTRVRGPRQPQGSLLTPRWSKAIRTPGPTRVRRPRQPQGSLLTPRWRKQDSNPRSHYVLTRD